MAFTDVWNAAYEAIPADTDQESLGAGVIRDLKLNVRERMAQDHSWIGDNNDGFHNFATLISQAADPVPSFDAGKTGASLYSKTVSGNVELFYRDSSGNVIQLTGNGLLLGGFSTGDAKPTFKTVADTGWVLANDGTIGDASSGGTTRANADTAALFSLLWTNISDTWAPVSGGRGASAAADFAAHKTLALTKVLGRALAIAGGGAGLTARALGQTLGEETHTLAQAELPNVNFPVTDPTHTHTYVTFSGTLGTANGGNNTASGATQAPATSAAATGISVNSGGSGTPFNQMQPTSFVNFMIKL